MSTPVDAATLTERWIAARGDTAAEAAVLADAHRYDTTHPTEHSLVDELCAISQEVAA